MPTPQPEWNHTPPGTLDTELTPERKELLSILPADRVAIEEHFGRQIADDLMLWGDRTKRVTWDPHASVYVHNPKFKGAKS